MDWSSDVGSSDRTGELGPELDAAGGEAEGERAVRRRGLDVAVFAEDHADGLEGKAGTGELADRRLGRFLLDVLPLDGLLIEGLRGSTTAVRLDSLVVQYFNSCESHRGLSSMGAFKDEI